MSPGRLFTIASELRNLTPGSVQFIEIPVVPYPGNPQAWVQWTQPQATTLFAAIAHDTKLPAKSRARAAAQTAIGKSPSPSPSPSTVSPAQVNVVVLNGSPQAGLATSTAAGLTSRGFHVVGVADASTSDFTDSIVQYASSADLPAAQTLAALISDAKIEQDTSLSAGTVQLILGSTFTTLGSIPAAPPSSSSSSGSQDLASQYGGITGNVQICNDSSAFAGPDGTN